MFKNQKKSRKISMLYVIFLDVLPFFALQSQKKAIADDF